jgi:hypothetical protein
MNLRNHAITQFDGFNFNSFAKNGESYMAANEDGLFLLGGNDDDGTDIDAFFILKNTDFGDFTHKRFLRAHFGYESDGAITFSLSPDEAAYFDKLVETGTTGKQGYKWVNLDTVYRGRYWQAKVSNKDGADFAIDSIILTGTGKKQYLLLSGSTGLSTRVDTTRIPYDPEAGVQALAQAVNVDIDDTGRVRRRQGFSELQAGSFHSLFCQGGHCLVIQEHTSTAALYRVSQDGVLTGIRSGLTKGRRMSFHSVNSQIYYSNGIETGIYDESTGASSPWAKNANIVDAIRVDREGYDPPPARNIASIGAFMLISDASSPSVLWWSDPLNFSSFNLDDGHIDLAHPVTMLKAVRDGVWVGTDRETLFISGVTPGEWGIARRIPYGVNAFSGTHEPVSAVRLGLEHSEGEGFLWLSDRGVCWGGNGGQYVELGHEAVDWREWQGNTGGALLAEDKVIFTLEP